MTAKPYITRAGEARKQLVGGQALHLLAGGDDTAGSYGVVICDSNEDARPIPRHYHEKEHDTWLCLRGKLRVWANDTSRILLPGDFAYVPPMDTHSYQCVAPRTTFFGVVSPGGWEAFFDMAGEPWTEDGLPEPGHPIDFSKMGPAMGKYDVHPVEQVFADVENGDATDRALPVEKSSYMLQAGYGTRHRHGRALITQLLSRELCDNMIDMRTIESGRNTETPSLVHDETHVSFFIVEGRYAVTLAGETSEVGAGDYINIPAGTAYSLKTVSDAARLVATGGNGNGLEIFISGAEETELAHFETAAESAKFVISSEIDARIV